jgi:hypothetical protein
MGTETAIPSGILWIAIANVIGRATCILFKAEVKVAFLPGNLWIPIESATIIPVFFNPVCFLSIPPPDAFVRILILRHQKVD